MHISVDIYRIFLKNEDHEIEIDMKSNNNCLSNFINNFYLSFVKSIFFINLLYI